MSASTHAVDDGAPGRLLIALAASAALHASLLYTVRFVPPRAPGTPFAALQARLEPAPSPVSDQAVPQPSTATRSAHVPRSSQHQPAEQPGSADAPASPMVRAAEPAAISEPVPPPAPQPALELPGVRDLTWYPARQLDVFPRPLVAYKPVYPEQAGAEGLRGEVTLLLLIDEEGAVHEASVVEAQPPGHFEQAALAAFEGARFEPARKDGRAVRSRILVKMAFSPEPGAD